MRFAAMIDPADIDLAARPKLPEGVALRQDGEGGRMVLAGRGRVAEPNLVALDILRLCNGERSIADLVDELSGRYAADMAIIEGDLRSLLSDLQKRGLVDF